MLLKFDWLHKRWNGNEGARLFENLCYDLISKMGFSKIIWRAGSQADEGRDIEATLIIPDPIEDQRIEKWYIECKNYSRAISVSNIETKISWCDANKPTTFLIITNSFLSNQTKKWIKSITKDKVYRITYMERPKLEEEIQKHQEIFNRYFPSVFDIEIEKPYLYLLDNDIIYFKKGIELFQQSNKKDEIIDKLKFTFAEDGPKRIYAGEALEILGYPSTIWEIEIMIKTLEKEHPGYISDFIKEHKNNKYSRFIKKMMEIFINGL